MTNLVQIVKNDIFTDSLVIAEGTDNKHESVQRRIRDYEKEISSLGKLGFEIRPMKSGQEMKIYLLNEPQATFLITLLKNTEIVVNFKLELVKQFYKMRQFILERQTTQWIETRKQGKLTRKSETDVIKELVEYAKNQGSKNAEMLYMTYSKLANKMAGIDKRDNATINQLNNLSLIENIILHCIRAGIEQEKHYKKIYQDCKARLVMFKDIAYLEAS